MLLALALLTALHTAPATDSMSGKWQITGDVMGTPVKTICAIKQEGTALTGNCSDESNEPHPLTGTSQDGKVTFQYMVDYQGQPLTVVYSGTFAAPTQLKGNIEVKPMGAAGTFTATAVPAKP
ncbi:MAG: hypothetical protein ABIT20_05150 [Gemmatimonadaceae bacterium]